MSSLVQPKWISSARPDVLGLGGDRGEPPLEEVLDGLDVVDGDPLDLGQLGDLVGAEVVDDGPQPGDLVVGEGPHAGDDAVGRLVDEPLDLDPDPGPVEGRLREVVDERGDGAAVAAVEGAEGDGWGCVSERGHGPILPEPGCRSRPRRTRSGQERAGERRTVRRWSRTP